MSLVAAHQIFRGSRLKIERGKKHVFELKSVLGRYVKENVYRGAEQHGSEGEIRLLQIIRTEPLPNEIPLIIGDAIHNLRAALDMAIWDSIPPEHRDRTVMFPICETPEALQTQLEKGKIGAHAPRIADIIINDIKSTKHGNSYLYGLHVLDIMDKHRLVIPVIDTIKLERASGSSTSDGEFFDRDFIIQWLRKGEATSTPPAEIQIEDYQDVIFTIRFRKGQPFAGKSVIPTLNKLSGCVSRIIDNLERASSQ